MLKSGLQDCSGFWKSSYTQHTQHTHTHTHMCLQHAMLFQPEEERELSPSPGYDKLLPKGVSVNGVDQPYVQESRSSLHSPDGVSTTKTTTLRNKLEGELFQGSRGKSLSHSPTPAPVDARRRTASSNQLPSESSKDEPPQFVQPVNIPVAPAFTPPISRAAAKQDKEKKSTKVNICLC